MAISKKTKAPTGLSVSRNGNTYTLSWKIGDKDYGKGQNLQYKVNGGAWQSPSISKTTTSYNITAANVVAIIFQVRGCRQDEKTKKGTTKFSWSEWSARDWVAVAPGIPSLTYKNEGVNKGTIEWSCPNDVTSNAVFNSAEYQTCIERNDAESGFGNASVQTKAATGSELVIEDSVDIAAGNFVRWFRIRAKGPQLYSQWATQFHAYGTPHSPRLTAASAVTHGSSTQITAAWMIASSRQYPVDKMKVQYAIAVPTDAALTAPSSGWSDAGGEIALRGSADRVVVNVSDAIDDDECLWVRVLADHDGNIAYSNELPAQIGVLQTPTIDATPNTSTGSVSITITEETSCSVAATAIFFRDENDPSKDKIVAILANGTTTATVSVPEIIGATKTCFGAYAFVGSYSGTTITSIKMRSGTAIDSDIPAVAPASVSITDGPADGTVRISWAWSWTAATKAELSWSSDDFAWESTAEPSKYKIEEDKANSWIIAGLEIGKRWFFRVRLIDDSGDSAVVGPWSAMVAYDLSSIPGRPVLSLSKSIMSKDDTLIARWATAMTGNDAQEYAEICLVTYDENTGDPVYGDVVAHTGQEQSVELEHEWETDETYYLAVRTTLTSGTQSEWSEVASLQVVDAISITLQSINIGIGAYSWTETTTNRIYLDDIPDDVYNEIWEGSAQVDSMSSTYFERYMKGENYVTGAGVIVTDEHNYTYWVQTLENVFEHEPQLTALPIVATIKGSGDSGTTMLSIVRAEDRTISRPDERDYDGYAGEIIATKTQMGESAITISASDLVGSLDDGAGYYLVGKVIDEYGRSASFQYPFWVNWTAKSFVPEVTVEMDPYLQIAKITPIAPSGSPTATCDIYRLSADKPQLIVKGATFGETYVDPYPAIGEAGGHRLVAITSNNDYATATGLGWYDAQEDDGDILLDDNMIIDVDGEHIVLPYDIELSNKWGKDFKRTSYLGGSVQGDWNPAVTRDLSANTVLVRGDDLDRQLMMRDLAGYAGIAHVRTPDGSSLTVNIQIDERQSYDTRKISYTLTMQAIDPEALDGMTLAEWEAMHPIGE